MLDLKTLCYLYILDLRISSRPHSFSRVCYFGVHVFVVLHWWLMLYVLGFLKASWGKYAVMFHSLDLSHLQVKLKTCNKQGKLASRQCDTSPKDMWLLFDNGIVFFFQWPTISLGRVWCDFFPDVLIPYTRHTVRIS